MSGCTLCYSFLFEKQFTWSDSSRNTKNIWWDSRWMTVFRSSSVGNHHSMLELDGKWFFNYSVWRRLYVFKMRVLLRIGNIRILSMIWPFVGIRQAEWFSAKYQRLRIVVFDIPLKMARLLPPPYTVSWLCTDCHKSPIHSNLWCLLALGYQVAEK